MAIFEQINTDLKGAMKAREKEKLEALRNIKKGLIEARAAKGAGTELTDEEALKVISKLAKQGADSAEIYRKQGRDDLAGAEMAQVKVFEEYLPEKMDDEALKAAVKDIIERTGASSMKDMGKVMGVATAELAGKAEGKEIVAKVKAMLQ